jgi:splicing factor 3B subunit 3
MNLYNLTLQRTTGIHKAIPGRFSSANTQEIVVSKVKHLELLRWNDAA